MVTDKLFYIAQSTDEGSEVQVLLKERLNIAAGMIKVLKYNKGILLDGEVVRGTATVKEGQVITALLNCLENGPEGAPPDIRPEAGALDIIYEDEALIVLNKPANTVIHPTCSHQSGTLLNYLMYYWQEKGIFTDAHLVGRLDKDTTGIVIIARNGYVQEALKRQSQQGEMKKYYLAAVSPPPSQPAGTVNAPISRDYDSIIKRKIDPEGGATAITHYKTLAVHPATESVPSWAIVEYLLETGRTHQIRLHSWYSGFPIIGDTLYGDTGNDGFSECFAPHQLLHAYKIEITHPVTGEKMVFKAMPPKEWGKYFFLAMDKFE